MSKNIKEVVESYGVKLWAEGSMFRGYCPLHDNKNTASFSVYENTNSWFCYGESIGGDAASFVSKIEGISYADALQKVNGVTDFQTEATEILDGLHVKDEVAYNDVLNFSLSKYCRDLIYRRPELTNNVLIFLRKLDSLLQFPVNHVIMNRTIKESRDLEKHND